MSLIKIHIQMKNYCIACLLVSALMAISFASYAQDDAPVVRNANAEDRKIPVEEKGFKKHNLFTGGTATVSFFSGGSVLGANPMLGYKLNNYFDAGVVLNFAYTGQRDYLVMNDKVRQFVYGPGVFVRAYPVPFIFAQAQAEQNFTTQKYIPPTGQSGSSTFSAPSLLLGAGYASGRIKGGTTFFYMSLLFDVLKNRNSPYVNVKYYGTPNERIDIVPVIRAGFNIGLFQGRYGRYQEY